MKGNLFVLFGALLLVGCGSKSAVEASVKERLKDPDSAKFQEFIKSDSGEYACIEWNAKNGFGGYGEWRVARLRKVDSSWNILEMEAAPSQCTEEAFVRRQDVDQANDKWRN